MISPAQLGQQLEKLKARQTGIELERAGLQLDKRRSPDALALPALTLSMNPSASFCNGSGTGPSDTRQSGELGPLPGITVRLAVLHAGFALG